MSLYNQLITTSLAKRLAYFCAKDSRALVTAAAKAGISERSARRIEKNELQPKAGQPRTWRTRKDPLVKVWDDIVVPILNNDPSVTAVGVFDYLCAHHAVNGQLN